MTAFSTAEVSTWSAAVGPTCNEHWVCNQDFVTTWAAARPLWPKRQLQYVRDPSNGDVLSVKGKLESFAELERHPAPGQSAAPRPPGQASAGWRTLATYTYDPLGNVKQSVGGEFGSASGPAACTAVTYDSAYAQFPSLVRRYTSGCGSASLDTSLVYDRGAESVVATEEPSGARSERILDPYGRPRQVFVSEPDAADPSFTILAATLSYVDVAPLTAVTVERHLGGALLIRRWLSSTGPVNRAWLCSRATVRTGSLLGGRRLTRQGTRGSRRGLGRLGAVLRARYSAVQLCPSRPAWASSLTVRMASVGDPPRLSTTPITFLLLCSVLPITPWR